MKLTRNKKFNIPKPLKIIRKEENYQIEINEIQEEESSIKSQSEEENKIHSESSSPSPKEENNKKNQNILFNMEEGIKG